jgi:hypothetical protein
VAPVKEKIASKRGDGLRRQHSRSIKSDMQSPRTKMLYFIYSAPNCEITDFPGLKSKMCKALGYSSDGPFYYDLDYLHKIGFVEEKADCLKLTKAGRDEFELCSSLSLSGGAAVSIGIVLFFYYLLLRQKLLTEDGIPFIAIILVLAGVFFSLTAKRNEPKLSAEAKELLREFMSA